MKAAAACYGIALDGIALAEACQWVENVIAESACGIMDQAASVLGDEGHVLPLLCQPCLPRPLVKLREGLRCWAIDSGVRHAGNGHRIRSRKGSRIHRLPNDLRMGKTAHSERRKRAHSALTDPRWQGFLSNVAPSVFRSKYEHRLPELISGAEILSLGSVHPDPFTTVRPEVKYRVRACTRYAIEENQRIELFIELARGHAQQPSLAAFPPDGGADVSVALVLHRMRAGM